MTYFVNHNCINCKHTSCVAACPVDAFREGNNWLAIDPDVCIDCGVCEPECPEEAIESDISDNPQQAYWLSRNAQLSKAWAGRPIITVKPAHPLQATSTGTPNRTSLLDPT